MYYVVMYVVWIFSGRERPEPALCVRWYSVNARPPRAPRRGQVSLHAIWVWARTTNHPGAVGLWTAAPP